MVKVASSSGKGFVNVEITGINEDLMRLRRIGKDVENEVDLTVVKLGAFAKEEVQESIIGNRAEPKSVDTGMFGNAIEVNKIETAHVVIEPGNARYPGGQSVKDVAKYLEYGTSKISPRQHFRNTEKRVKPKVIEEIQKAVKKGTG